MTDVLLLRLLLLQAARHQAAELEQLKQHLRQQLDEWASLTEL